MKSNGELLDPVAGQLLRAVKRKMLKTQDRVDRGKVRRDGCSEWFVARLEEV